MKCISFGSVRSSHPPFKMQYVSYVRSSLLILMHVGSIGTPEKKKQEKKHKSWIKSYGCRYLSRTSVFIPGFEHKRKRALRSRDLSISGQSCLDPRTCSAISPDSVLSRENPFNLGPFMPTSSTIGNHPHGCKVGCLPLGRRQIPSER